MASRVSEILRHVDNARQAEQVRCVRLLSELTPQVRKARSKERQRDRRQAPRFNAFKYLRTDELGLSRMIADLLDPDAEHGQGTKFLEAMLNAFPKTSVQFGALQPTAARPICVVTERSITDGRRIDITVEIPSTSGRSFCLAFENKPTADDQPSQISAYLEYLQLKYGTHFLLVYLPPVHSDPDPASFPPADQERWREHFTVMPYAPDASGSPSLKDWFAACRECCDAERVIWFLRAAESFCLEKFGESSMKIDPEAQSVRKYLTDNPSHLRAAYAVHCAWLHLSAEVYEQFLKHLRLIVERRLREELSGMEDDFRVRCRYAGEKSCSNSLWITRHGWMQYENLDNYGTYREGRTAIMLENGHEGMNGWYWGVCSPKSTNTMSENEKERQEKLQTALRPKNLPLEKSSVWWPQYDSLSRYQNWEPLVLDLHDECKAGGGLITDYYVDGLLDIAVRAIPAINEVEMAHLTISGE
ncbi:MAG: PD-(D/E)XK nuclease family protein [Bryobacterales bacterium]|nr:PD-(D/E)XK nuclease family protein [Bryobacterales bacterium]